MEQIEKRIRANFEKRMATFTERINYNPCGHENIVKRVLMLNSGSCFDLFRKSNETLSQAEGIRSFLVNTLYDDSFMGIKVYQATSMGGAAYIFDYGSLDDEYEDEYISQDEMLKIVLKAVEICERQDQHMLDHPYKQVEGVLPRDTEHFKGHFEIRQELKALFYNNLSQKQKEKADGLEKKRKDHVKEVLDKASK